MAEADLEALKSKYSVEDVNYFYETSFYQDYVGVKPSLTKWQEDIWMQIQGVGWKGDSAYVEDALKQINALQLPIRLRLTDDSTKANVVIYFGNTKYVSEKFSGDSLVPFRGVGKIEELPSGGLSATIGIANDATTYIQFSAADRQIVRHSVILEEITQVLGVTGDSWKEYQSIFFEGRNNIIQLQPIDKQVIRLLYEPSLPNGLSRQAFTSQFWDMLYATGAKRKLIAYAKEKSVSVGQLERIRDNSYPGSELVRFSGKVFLKVEGDYKPADVRFCQEAIALLNTASDHFQLEYVDNTTLQDFPCIRITFETRPEANPTAERTVKIGGLMVNRRIYGRIHLISGKSVFSEKVIHMMLFRSIYKMLGYDGIDDKVAERNSSGELQFRSRQKEALTLLYNPIIPDGFSKSDLNEVIQGLK